MPTTFASSTVLANGAFLKTTLPPPFSAPTRNKESFTLVGVDTTNPTVIATTPVQVVRLG